MFPVSVLALNRQGSHGSPSWQYRHVFDVHALSRGPRPPCSNPRQAGLQCLLLRRGLVASTTIRARYVREVLVPPCSGRPGYTLVYSGVVGVTHARLAFFFALLRLAAERERRRHAWRRYTCSRSCRRGSAWTCCRARAKSRNAVGAVASGALRRDMRGREGTGGARRRGGRRRAQRVRSWGGSADFA